MTNNQEIEDFKVIDGEVADDVQQGIDNLAKSNVNSITISEAVQHITSSPNFKLDPKQQYHLGGKLYQRVAKYRPHRHSKYWSYISIVVDHTANSKYSGAMLRKLRAERGVGQVKNIRN